MTIEPSERRMDWPALLRVGLRGLGLSPQEFWGLTPAELMLKLGSEEAQRPLGRSRLEELAKKFPDTPFRGDAPPK